MFTNFTLEHAVLIFASLATIAGTISENYDGTKPLLKVISAKGLFILFFILIGTWLSLTVLDKKISLDEQIEENNNLREQVACISLIKEIYPMLLNFEGANKLIENDTDIPNLYDLVSSENPSNLAFTLGSKFFVESMIKQNMDSIKLDFRGGPYHGDAAAYMEAISQAILIECDRVLKDYGAFINKELTKIVITIRSDSFLFKYSDLNKNDNSLDLGSFFLIDKLNNTKEATELIQTFLGSCDKLLEYTKLSLKKDTIITKQKETLRGWLHVSALEKIPGKWNVPNRDWRKEILKKETH